MCFPPSSARTPALRSVVATGERVEARTAKHASPRSIDDVFALPVAETLARLA